MNSFRRQPLALSIGALLIASTSLSALATPPVTAVTSNAINAITVSAESRGSDPLYRYQWHLSNQGQAVIGDSRPVPGVDLDVDILHGLNIRGRGVRVGVVDDGLELRHEDLADNILPNGSYNFGDRSHDTTPVDPDNGHGTAVAGIIGAVGWNGRGGRGVAPEVLMAGFDFLARASSDSDANIRYAWGDGPEARNIDIFNNSWGSVAPFYLDFPVEEQQSWEALMRSSRGGRGAIYVKSAGNSFVRLRTRDESGNVINLCSEESRVLKVGCSLANIDPRSSLPGTIVVASVDATGQRASYSSSGSALWVSGLGGEFGRQRKFDPDAASRAAPDTAPYVYDPAIVTTDLSGCAAGDNVDGLTVDNALDGSKSRIDALCNYNAIMNGTSAAAPTVSGVAALIVSTNPSLNARDVKYILAKTARQVDPWQPPAVYQGSVIDPGWITNAAGHRFSNWYGFGLVDGAAAVYEARYFKPLPPVRDTQWVASTAAASQIGGPARPAKQRIRISQTMKVEGVQLSLATSHRTPTNLRVVLESPSGTRSYVVTPFSVLDLAAYAKTGFYIDLTSSNAFLDERAQGVWTLEVTDMTASTSTAALQNFKLRILGH
ncbi:S8 family peptidase [Xanthomonas vesicatoria]|uniref:S8 family peptidase n=1 Tax=Xanthomonas vesicatoria TaxID=56460 RepID=UPI000731EF2D|nr:S8 family peptidase [Xanthomonas vesicatoria]KTF36228.1 peptidase S8 [Xanthomonas vesicatoria]MCC8556702.1 S8 family serine peptidase [Xanthomonas vesicatoria]MCC8599747.1 S8 family serine peptidase [Xanthomonas vesicatoria]MCC8609748.1 S8 family serine peptidase [Xanthomonas vesicatoria]MCC8672330.1 S8 family serine peptidase [Xanthomonas vesicatoria]